MIHLYHYLKENEDNSMAILFEKGEPILVHNGGQEPILYNTGYVHIRDPFRAN